MSTFATASDGAQLDLDSLPQTLAYSGGQISTITVAFAGHIYVQTFSYTAGVLTGVSNWVKTS